MFLARIERHLAPFLKPGELIYWSQDYTFRDPYDLSLAVPGPIRWDRIGGRLD